MPETIKKVSCRKIDLCRIQTIQFEILIDLFYHGRVDITRIRSVSA